MGKCKTAQMEAARRARARARGEDVPLLKRGHKKGEPGHCSAERAAAKAAGATHYFTGRPCVNGHVARRSVKGDCVECVAERERARRGSRKESSRAYRQANREKVREWKRRSYHANAEKLAQKLMAKRRENLEAFRERDRRRYARNAAAINARVIARDALKICATPAWADAAAITAIYEEAQRRSQETGIKHHVDHIVPLRNPVVCGLHVPGNLRVITAEENTRKGNRLLVED